MISASCLHRAAACPASTVLPGHSNESPAAHRGTAIHAYLQNAHELGRDAALDIVPEEYRDACESLDLSRLPIGQTNSFAELAMAVDLSTGTARELGTGLERDYQVEASEVPGTADVVIVPEASDRVVVIDYKTGHAVLPRPEDNYQLRLLGFAASRIFKRPIAQVIIIHTPPGMAPKVESATLDEFALDLFEDELQEIARQLAQVQVDSREGRHVAVNAGDHCTFCPALNACAYHRDLAAVMAQDPEALETEITEMTAAEAWRRVRAAERVVERVKDSLKTLSKRAAIDLGDGKRLGAVEKSVETIDAETARAVLVQAYGPEVSRSATRLAVSKSSISSALKDFAKRSGVPLAQLNREALSAIRDKGGSRRTTRVEVREFNAAKEEVGS